MRKLLSTVLLSILFSGVLAQKYPFKTYTIKDGLAQSQVSAIAQDRFGFLWVGTQSGGLSRFDGQYFKNFNKKDGLPSIGVNALLFSKREDKLWIGTENGLAYFDGVQFNNVDFSTFNEFDGEVQELFEDHLGQIWFATMGSGIRQYSTGKIKQFSKLHGLPESRVSDMIQLDDKRLLLSTYMAGVYELKDTVFVKLEIPLNEKDRVVQIHQYNSDVLLIATPDLIYQYNLKSQEFSVFLDLIKDFKTRMILDFEKDKSGTLWIATGRGVIAYHAKDNAVLMDAEGGFSDETVVDVFIDAQENIWLASEIGGLSKFLGEHFSIYDKSLGGTMLPAIMGVNIDADKRIWVNTFGDGVYVLENQRFVRKSLKGDNLIAMDLATLGNKIWVATSSGIIEMEGDKRRNYTVQDGLPINSVISIELDYQNKLWATTRNGVAVSNGNRFEIFPSFNVEKFGVPRSLYKDENLMLISTVNRLFLYDGDSLLEYSRQDIFEDNRILCVQPLGNRKYLVGTLGEGVFQIDFSSQEFTNIGQTEGLLSDIIYQISKDDKGIFYIGTEKGISQVEFLESGISVRNLDSEGGFLALETNQSAVAKDQQGNLWIGTVAGLYRLDPQKLKTKTQNLRTNLLWVGPYYETNNWEAEYPKRYGWFNLPDKLTIPYTQNHLLFKFAAIDLTQPKEVYYRVKLEGFDKDWSEPIAYGKAAYPNLPAGTYTMLVQASSVKGGWGSDFLSYDFVVKPPFWQTWWFYSIAILVVGLSIKFIQDRRIQIQVERAVLIEKIKADEHEKIRKSVSRDFHDELGNHLASIIVMVQMMRQKLLGKQPEAIPLVNQMEDSARTLFNGTRDFIWSIDPENDTMDAVYGNIKDFGEELFDHTNFNFYTETVPSDVPAVRLPANWSRHITLLFKEAMTNSLKYAEGTEVRLIWRFNEPSQLTITFQDNGKGFEYEPEKSKRGLANMHHRAQKIDGKLHIYTDLGQGCKVQLHLRIPTIG